jgi:hypothetical protein
MLKFLQCGADGGHQGRKTPADRTAEVLSSLRHDGSKMAAEQSNHKDDGNGDADQPKKP